MAKIALSDNSFSVAPEGVHIFKIEEVEYKEAFGKLNITMKTKEGYTHIERFSFVKANGEPNEVAIGIFSLFAKIALQNFDLEEIDHTDLVGKYIKCEVTHDVQPNKNDPSRTVTFSRLGNKAIANGFDDVPTTPTKPAVKSTPAPSTPKKVDLSAILGRK